MIDKVSESTTSSAYGKKLDAPLTYSYPWKAYETIDEMKAANDLLSDDEQVSARNEKRQAAARAAAYAAKMTELGHVKPTIENDDQLRLRDMLKVLMSSKRYTEAEARELAANTLGLTWAE